MQTYADRTGKFGVIEFEIRPDAIHVKFKQGDTYIYSYRVPGRAPVERMKQLATAGQGLATYIAKVIKKRFESRY